MKKSNGRRQEAAPTASIRMTKPISMLKNDHKKLTDLFDKFERANDARTQWEVARKAIHELKIHSAIEEELFYPSVGKIVRDEDLMNEAAEEHHGVTPSSSPSVHQGRQNRCRSSWLRGISRPLPP